MSSTSFLPEIQRALVIAHGKLPDDLALEEFNALTGAVSSLSETARSRGGDYAVGASGALMVERAESPVVLKVQYGSDFIVALGIISMSAAAGGAVAGVFVGFAKALDFLASAGLKNEERLNKRDERLARRMERKRAEAVLSSTGGLKPGDTAHDIGNLRAVRHGKSTGAYGPDALRHARELILPRQVRQELDERLPESARTDSTYIAMSELAEYGVEIKVDRHGNERAR